mmetsp:Transcript_28313/g.90610  ORF Transcript_28313/g.90610 Transcript_28313/m.90610 type:complete len:139 (-) Transcript_28313:490-906(-)
MGRNFLQLRNFLEVKFPDLIGHITAEVYPPPPGAEIAAQLTGMLQLVLLACLFLGSSVFKAIGFKEDSPVVKFVEENKMMLFIGCFLLNNVAANLTKTGAFEIMLGDKAIFSKLETGRFPKAYEVVEALKAAGLAPSA